MDTIIYTNDRERVEAIAADVMRQWGHMMPRYDTKLSPTEARDQNRGTLKSERERKAGKAPLPKRRRAA